MADLNATGIYAIINVESDKVYVGSTGWSFKGRWKGHRTRLRGRCHKNGYLQRSWNKHGENAFEFIVLEYVDNPAILVNREQYHLDEIRLICEVYNRGPVAAAPWLGATHSEESKAKMSKARKGCKFSEEHKRRIGEANKRREWSKESKDNASKAKQGKRNPNYGIHPSDETRRKISEALKGREFSKEHRARISNCRARPYPAFIHRETGKIIPAGINLQALCQEQGLGRGNMCAVAHGRKPHYKGWVLYKNRHIKDD